MPPVLPPNDMFLVHPIPIARGESYHSNLDTQVLDHIEAEIFGAGRGDYDSCHLLLAALLERPAITVRAHRPTCTPTHTDTCPLAPHTHTRQALPSLYLTRCLDPTAG